MARDVKPIILLLGKVPPPHMGPAVATQHILDSSLIDYFRLFHQDTRLNRELEGMGRWIWHKPFRQLAILAGLKWKIVRYRPKVVWIPISQSTGGFVKDSIYILTSRLLGRKILIHLRGSNFRNWLDQSPGWVNRYVRFVLRRCAGVIVLGECLRYLFEDFFPPERIFVVPNGANYDIPARSRKKDGVVRIAYLGNLQPTKGIEDVIRSMVSLKKYTQKQFELQVVGAWRDEATRKLCLDMVNEYDLPVHFLPPRFENDKLQFLADADILVFAPRAPEGHPWVIVEGLAAGLPIVATDQGAIRESVTFGENGFLVQPQNPGEIALRLKQLVEDDKQRETMGKRSREIYLESFSMERMVERLRTTLNVVMGERSCSS